jgi:hypothetical protein
MIERDDVWWALWDRAVREMAPFDRRPGWYLIDNLASSKKGDRAWLADRLSDVARVTRARPADETQDDGTLRWWLSLTSPRGALQSIRILVNVHGEIFNAFPDRRRSP